MISKATQETLIGLKLSVLSPTDLTVTIGILQNS